MSTGHWRTPRSRLTALLLGIGLAITCTTQMLVPAQGATPAARVPSLVAPGPVTGVTVTAATTSSITLSWTNPTSANFTGVMIRRAAGSTPPATPTSGTLVIDKAKPATSHVNTGLAAGTQYSYALFAHDAVPSYAAAATTTTTTSAATTSDWSQARHDSGHRGWSATETLISPTNVRNVVEEWTAPGGAPAIAGNLVYVISTEPLGNTGVLTAYNLTTGVVSWQIGTGTCKAGPVSVTATLVIIACGAQPRAYERGDDHGLVWDTTESDPDQNLQNHLVLGNTMVAWSQDRVAAFRLSDGQRVWQQLLPAGATWIHDVAASGTSVVVAYDDRLRALSVTNGGQLWSKANVRTSQIVIADGWVYTNNGNGVSRYSLAAGAAGWSVLAGQNVYRIEAADNGTIYVWNAVFDFGPPSPSVLRALRTTDGSQRWQYNVPSRIGSVAVTGGLVWLTSTEIYSQGRGSDLIALNRLTGVQLKQFHFEDNMYGWTDVGFGAGKAIVHQGGSFGGATPATLRVLGLAGRRPTISTPRAADRTSWLGVLLPAAERVRHLDLVDRVRRAAGGTLVVDRRRHQRYADGRAVQHGARAFDCGQRPDPRAVVPDHGRRLGGTCLALQRTRRHPQPARAGHGHPRPR